MKKEINKAILKLYLAILILSTALVYQGLVIKGLKNELSATEKSVQDLREDFERFYVAPVWGSVGE